MTLVRLGAVAAVTALSAVLAIPLAGAGKKPKSRRRPEPTAVPRQPDPSKVTFLAADGVVLAASFVLAADPAAPALLLIHPFSRDRRVWEPYAPELYKAGFSTLALDLRGHGESTRKGGATFKLTPRLLDDPAQTPQDIRAATSWLRVRLPGVRIGLVGDSLGGDLGVALGAAVGLEAVVALSPNADRIARLARGPDAEARNALLLATEEDINYAGYAQKLFESLQGLKASRVFPGSAAHGLAIFQAVPASKTMALGWLSRYLSPGASLPAPQPVETARPEAPTPAPATASMGRRP